MGIIDKYRASFLIRLANKLESLFISSPAILRHVSVTSECTYINKIFPNDNQVV